MRALRTALALLACALAGCVAPLMGATINGPTHITVGQIMPAANMLPQLWQASGLLSLGGIAALDAARTTVCATVAVPTGKTPPATGDDISIINAGINACPAGQVLMLSCGTYQLDQSEYIALNKGITIRGCGSPIANCIASAIPCWGTVINVHNGAVADWLISAATAGANCGVTPAAASGCTQATGVFLMSPSGNYNWGWAGCFLGTNPTTGNCGTKLTADAAQGASTVTVASTANLAAGAFVLIDETPLVVSTTNPTGGTALQATADFLTSAITPVTLRLEGGDIPGAYSLIGSGQNQRLNAEIKQIASISGNNLTFTTPLTMPFRQSGSHDARVYWPTVQGATANPFLQKAGIENLTINKAANSAVQMTFCAWCFMSNVECNGWIAGCVNFNYSYESEAAHSYFVHCLDCENNGTEYPVGINQGSSGILVDDNIIVLGGKGMVGRGACCSVVAYNYVDMTMYMAASIGDYWMDMGCNGSHYAGAHSFEFEGNVCSNCDSDETHGNATNHVFFRNWCMGVRTTFVDPSNGKTVNDAANSCWGNQSVPSGCAPDRAAGPMAFDYWFAFVGNVLGKAGVTTAANGWVYQGAFCGGNICTGGFATNKMMWGSGWVGGEEPSTDPHLTSTVAPYLFKHDNFDYVTNGVADAQAGYSMTLPNSLYLPNGKAPSYFLAGVSCTYPFPPFDPAASPPVHTNSCGGADNPAEARYQAGAPFGPQP